MKKEIKLDVGGFTLLELMIVLSIAAILVAVAVPSFRTTIQNNKIATQANALLSALHFTRSEAVKLGSDTTICSTIDSTTCSNDLDWSTGWMVVEDPAADPVNVMKVWEALSGNPTFTGPNSLTYTSIGNVTASATFNLTIPDCKGDQKRVITVSLTGHPSVTKSSCP